MRSLLWTMGLALALLAPPACGPSVESSPSNAPEDHGVDLLTLKGVFHFVGDEDGCTLTLVPDGNLATYVRIASIESVESLEGIGLRSADESDEQDDLPLEWEGDEAVFGVATGHSLVLTLSYRDEPQKISCRVAGNPSSGMTSSCEVPKTLYCRYRNELEARGSASTDALDLESVCAEEPSGSAGTKSQEEDDSESSQEGDQEAS